MRSHSPLDNGHRKYIIKYSSMEYRPSWEATRSSDSQQISRILWSPKVYYRIQNPATYPNPKPDRSSPYPHPTSRRSILILSSHLSLDLQRCLFPSGFPTKTMHGPSLSPVQSNIAVNKICVVKHNTIKGKMYKKYIHIRYVVKKFTLLKI